ncbi:MAG: TasA family protein [Chloroflexota bacterium]
MKKILGLSIVALLVMGLVGGGTWAYFSDTEQTATNVLTAGTLDLVLSGGTAGAVFSMSNVVPGQSDSTGNVTLTKSGSVEARLDIEFSDLDQTGLNDGSEFADNNGDLGDKVEIAAFLDLNNDGFWSPGDCGLNPVTTGNYSYSAGPSDWVYATLNTWKTQSWSGIVASMTGPYKFAVPWKIPGATTGNEIQGDSANFTIFFTLTQASAP